MNRTFRGFRTSPLNVAVRRDFNRIDVEGLPPDAVESALAPVEQKMVDSIRAVVQRRDFPTPDELNNLLNFIALLSARNPNNRDAFNRANVAVAHSIADILTSDPNIFERTVQKARESGETIPDISFEDMRDFVRQRRYEVEVSTGTNVSVEIDAIDAILPLLAHRSWSMIFAPENGPEFVCSDHPISLFPKGNISGPFGLGSRMTELFVPLAPEAGILGVYENAQPETFAAHTEQIAALNSRTFNQAKRQVYARYSPIYVMTQEGVKTVTFNEDGQWF